MVVMDDGFPSSSFLERIENLWSPLHAALEKHRRNIIALVQFHQNILTSEGSAKRCYFILHNMDQNIHFGLMAISKLSTRWSLYSYLGFCLPDNRETWYRAIHSCAAKLSEWDRYPWKGKSKSNSVFLAVDLWDNPVKNFSPKSVERKLPLYLFVWKLSTTFSVSCQTKTFLVWDRHKTNESNRLHSQE